MKISTASKIAAVALGAIVALAACSSPSNGDDDNAADKQLVIDFQLANSSADPHKDGTVVGRTLFRPVYDTLTQFDSANLDVPDPGLATEWTTNDTATEWTFTIRSGVKFSDGTPLTADDVVFSLNRFKNLKTAFSFLLDGVTVSSPDEETVVLSTEAPNISLPYVLAYPEMTIMNSTLLKEHGGTDAEDADQTDTAEQFLMEQSAGSGPYVMTTFSTTDRIVYEANENYWGDPAPYSRIVVENTNSQAQIQNVQNGRANVALDINNAQLDALGSAQTDALQIAREAGPVVWYFYLNMNADVSETTSNPDFREALRYAIDYDALGELMGQGARQSCGIIPSMIQASLPEDECVTQDLPRAKEALARSGLTNPTLDFEYLSDYAIDGIQTETVAQFLQGQFEAIGVTVNLAGNPLSTELDRYNSGTLPALLWSVSMRYPDLSSYVNAFTFGANAKPAGLVRGVLPEVDTLADEILSATSADDRVALTEEWQRKLNESGPYVPLYQSARVLVGSPDLSGMELSPLYLLDFRNLGHAED